MSKHAYYVEPVILVRHSKGRYKMAVIIGESKGGGLVYAERSSYCRRAIAKAMLDNERHNTPKQVAICPVCRLGVGVSGGKLDPHDAEMGHCLGTGVVVGRKAPI